MDTAEGNAKAIGLFTEQIITRIERIPLSSTWLMYLCVLLSSVVIDSGYLRVIFSLICIVAAYGRFYNKRSDSGKFLSLVASITSVWMLYLAIHSEPQRYEISTILDIIANLTYALKQ